MVTMDLFSRIREEHRELLAITDALIGADPATHRKAMNELTMRITTHMNAEEQTIYQAFEELDPIPRSLAFRHEQEHHIAKFLMNELQEKVRDQDVWAAKLQVFQGIIQRHVESEERTMFDLAGDYFTDAEIQKITNEFARVELDLYESSRIEPLKAMITRI